MKMTTLLILVVLMLATESKQTYGSSRHVLERTTKCSCRNPVHQLISNLQWTAVALLGDTFEGDIVPYSVKQEKYNIDDIDTYAVLGRIHASFFPEINIILAVNTTRTKDILKEVDTFDFISNGTTDFRHHSKVLVLAGEISELTTIEEVTRYLENVAVVFGSINCSDMPVDELDTFTIHIHPTKRVFSHVPVGETNVSLADRMYPNIKYGYNNRQLLVTTLQTYPYVWKDTINGTSTYTGYVFDIWETVARRLNFSYEITEPEDQTWGVFTDGRWSGMVGQLIKREVDAAVADLSVYYGRAQHIDYITPSFMVDGTDVIYRRQPPKENTFSLLLRPLRINVYILFLTVTIGTIVIFTLTEHQYCLMMMSISDKGLQGLPYKLFNTSFEFFGTVFKQEFKVSSSSVAGKVLLSSWWILVLVITSVYTANLIAALSSQSESKLTSISDLLDSDYTTGTLTLGMPYETMKESNRTEIKRLFSGMVEASKHDAGIFLNDRDAQIARVKKGKHAFVMYKAVAAKYLANDCHLELLGESVTWAEEHITFALPKGSPLKSDIDRIMHNLKESGILDMWWSKWTARQNTSTCVVDREVTAITLKEVAGGFVVVCGGLALSALVLTMEICEHRLRKVYLKKQ